MNFSQTEEQAMLADSINKFIQAEYEADKRHSIANNEMGFSADHWKTYASLGWLSVPFAEKYGGFGGDINDVAVMTELFGKGLVLEPFIETVVLFGGLLQASLSTCESARASDSHSALLVQLINGEYTACAALTEKGTRFNPYLVRTTAETTSNGYRLVGSKVNVSNLPSARYSLVTARTQGDPGDRDGISLFLIDCESDAISRTSFKLMDGRRAGNLAFEGLEVDKSRLLGQEGKAADLLDAVLPTVLLAECAEAMGIMEHLNTTTLEYTKVRKQFGMPIGSFQALQHRMVDTFMAFEQLKSLLFRALISFREGGHEFALDLAALKVQSGRSGKLIASEAIQIHGGMGVTDELAVGHYMKRLRMLNASYGDADYHQNRYNTLSFT